MSDFERIKQALLKGGYTMESHIEIKEYAERKYIYLSHCRYDAFDTCFEFDKNGKILEIN